MASDETLPEHLVSIHMTTEGLCNICCKDSEDFFEHFKIHLKKCASHPMVVVKAELTENTDFNQTCVKDEAIRLVRNPFFAEFENPCMS